MGKTGAFFIGHVQGNCRGCGLKFVGPGDRCPKCAQALRDKLAKRKRRKRR